MRVNLLLVFAAAGCTEYNVQDKKGDEVGIEGDGAPDIVVDPLAIDFGLLGVGEGQSATEVVTIGNEGTQSLQISGVELEDATAPYDIGAVSSFLIAPGDEAQFTVTFEPVTANEATTKVGVTSNDPDEALVYVDLTGIGEAPAIEVTPNPYDFGSVEVGCDNVVTLQVKNSGNADLDITDYVFTSASVEFSFDLNEVVNGSLPWKLEPEDYVEVYVAYTALDEEDDTAYLTFVSNDPYMPEYLATQTGTGDPASLNTDIFEQPLNGMSDILFVFDNSSSMDSEQELVLENFEYFAAGLSELDVDFQLAIITVEDPEFVGDIITNDSSVEAEFLDQMSMPIMSGVTESPSEMIYQCASAGGDCEPGGEFLREDAKLSIIVVSDETDQSPGGWEEYLEFFQTLHEDLDNVVVHAISGDYPRGCGDASATNKIYEMTVETGGLYLSICATDWASYLEDLVEGSAYDLSSFQLSETPVPDTITVVVDDVPVTSGWYYNEAGNSVDFVESSVPDGGSIIEITYAVYGDCEG
jgi:hypothetical protein